MGKPILAAHFMGRRLLLDDIYAAENGGILFGDEALPLRSIAQLAEADSSEAFGNAADSFISDDAVLPDAKSGVSLGSVAEGEAYLDVSPTPVGVLGLEHETPYINGASRLPAPNGAIGLEHSTPYINGTSHIPEINGSIITGHEAPAINGASKLETVNDGAAVKQYAETLTADCVFHEADDGTGAGENVEMFKTVVPVWGEGNNGGGFGENAGSVTFDAAFAESVSGEMFGNDAEAYVELPPIYTGDFLSFSSNQPFSIGTRNSAKYWDGVLEYSTDATTWNVWDGSTAIGNALRLYIRGIGNTKITGSYSGNWTLTATAGVKVQGTLETLLDYATAGQGLTPAAADHCFLWLFGDWAYLEDAGDLVIMTYSPVGYCESLFQRCFRLTKAPALGEATIGSVACAGMYYGCTSLVNPPAGVIKGFLTNGYGSSHCMSMFNGCTSLTTPVLISLTSSAILTNSLYQMYYGCTSLEKLPRFRGAAPANIAACQYMFRGCSKIKLSATEAGEYVNAFRIPWSGTAATIGRDALKDMFTNTGGTFTGTPSANTYYYTSNEVIG